MCLKRNEKIDVTFNFLEELEIVKVYQVNEDERKN